MLESDDFVKMEKRILPTFTNDHSPYVSISQRSSRALNSSLNDSLLISPCLQRSNVNGNYPSSRRLSNTPVDSEQHSYQSYSALTHTSYPTMKDGSADMFVHSEDPMSWGNLVTMTNDSYVDDVKSTCPDNCTHTDGICCSEGTINGGTSQLRVGLTYKWNEEKLTMTIGEARHLYSLCHKMVKYVYVEGLLLPPYTTEDPLVLQTSKSNDTDSPCFNGHFSYRIERDHLVKKTLKVNIIGFVLDTMCEQYLGGLQISLAEFESIGDLGVKWYNLLANCERPVLDAKMDAEMCKRWSAALTSTKPVTRSSCTNSPNLSERPRWTPSPHLLYNEELQFKVKRIEKNRELERIKICGSRDRGVTRSVSDCSGYKRRPNDDRFIRNGDGRRSLRHNPSRISEHTLENSTKPRFVNGLSVQCSHPHDGKHQEAYDENSKMKMSSTDVNGDVSRGLPRWLCGDGDKYDTLLKSAYKEQQPRSLLRSSIDLKKETEEHPKVHRDNAMVSKMLVNRQHLKKTEVHWV